MSLSDIYSWLLLNTLVYFVLAVYFDNILPGGSGKPKPLWYFLLPSYWTGNSGHKKNRSDYVDDEILDDEFVRLYLTTFSNRLTSISL